MSEKTARVVDQGAREQALDISRSLIVQAPAGSGKTELLTQRLLKLLARVEHPEEVLALTFTRKAAGEMRDRLLGALRRARDQAMPDSEHEITTRELARELLEVDAARGWRLLEHPSRLRITTIDSLCSNLARQMPLLARLGATFDIAGIPELLYREAATNTVKLLGAHHPVTASLRALLAHLDNSTGALEQLLARMLGKREQWLRHVLPAGKRLERDGLEAALARLVHSELLTVRAAIPDEHFEAICALAIESATVLANEPGENPLEAILACPHPGAEPAQLPAWRALVDLLLTSSGRGDWRRRWDKRLGFPPGDKGRKQAVGEIVAGLQGVPECLDALRRIRELPDPVIPEQQWQALQALLEVLPVAAAELELVFRQRGKVDYTAVARAALDALGEVLEPSDLALALDYRIQHILVDEFQDTSASQFGLLSQLIAGWTPDDGRTLFCVGDPMQSIYRFREAEVGLFLRAWEEGIGDLALTPVRLSVNFRSQQGVVDWVNQTFPAVMPVRADTQTAAVPYTRSDGFHEALPGAPVRFHPLLDQSPADEAREVALIVKHYREAEPDKRIAVLVRSRNHLREIMPVMRAAGHLPQAVEIEQLDRIPLVHDLVALTRALLHLGDRSAWLAVLRAPWCGLSLNDLNALAGVDHARTVWSLIAGGAADRALSEEGGAALARLRAALGPVLRHAGRKPLRRWVEGAWRRLGGPACVANKSDLASAESFFSLLATLSSEDAMEDPAVLDQRLQALYAAPDPAADPGLWVMTIHKAKGLQFDVVILPGLDRSSSTEDRQLLRWMEIPRSGSKIDLVLSPLAARADGADRLDDYLRRLEQRRRDLESSRLLYVAVTRARERVHLLGRVRSKDQDGERVLQRPGSRTMLAALWSAASPWFEAELASGPEHAGKAENADDGVTSQERLIFRLPATWQTPQPGGGLAFARKLQHRFTLNEESISFDWAGQTARHVGTVVHEALRTLADTGSAKVSKGLLRRVAGRLRELGVQSNDRDDSLQLARTALENCCSDPRGRWILSGEHREARNELALTRVRNGVLTSVVLDRTFVDEDGVRWIVDYKIGVHEGRDREAFFDRELERYREQLQHYAETMTRCDVRPVRVALYFPLYGGWRSWDPFALADAEKSGSESA